MATTLSASAAKTNAANGGKLTASEKTQVNHEQNQASRNIHHKKHNDATQPKGKD